MHASRARRWQVLLLAVLGLGSAALWYAAFAYPQAEPTTGNDSGSESSSASPGGSDGSPSPSATSTSDPGQLTKTLPEVRDRRRADFAAGDPLPDGSRTRDSAAVSSPMVLAGGLLGHGPPSGQRASSWLEARLGADVRSLGARVRFPDGRSGSIALVAWQSSVVDWSAGGLPPTGMRLVAEPGQWRVIVFDGSAAETILQGTYPVGGANPEAPSGGCWRCRQATFRIVRDGDTLWVRGPNGQVSTVTDPRIEELAGPWASWELRETSPRDAPAAFDKVWAG